MKTLHVSYALLGLIVFACMPIFGMNQGEGYQVKRSRPNKLLDIATPGANDINLDAIYNLHVKIQELEEYIKAKKDLSENVILRATANLNEARISMQRALSQKNPLAYNISLICVRQRIIAAERILGLSPTTKQITLF